VSSGLKEIEGDTFKKMTEELLKIVTQEKDKEVHVKPQVVLEVAYEEIQKSTTYTSGYALRFPRILRVREDKPVDEITTLSQVDEFFIAQKGGTRS